jgi:hypothetical protein
MGDEKGEKLTTLECVVKTKMLKPYHLYPKAD